MRVVVDKACDDDDDGVGGRANALGVSPQSLEKTGTLKGSTLGPWSVPRPQKGGWWWYEFKEDVHIRVDSDTGMTRFSRHASTMRTWNLLAVTTTVTSQLWDHDIRVDSVVGPFHFRRRRLSIQYVISYYTR